MIKLFEKYYNKETRKYMREKYNMSQGQLSSYSKGYSTPKPKKLLAICKAFSEVHEKQLDDILFEALEYIKRHDLSVK